MVESVVLSCLVIDLNTITELFKKEISPDSWYCRVFFWGTTNLFPVISDSFKDFHEDVGIDRWICKSYIYIHPSLVHASHIMFMYLTCMNAKQVQGSLQTRNSLCLHRTTQLLCTCEVTVGVCHLEHLA